MSIIGTLTDQLIGKDIRMVFPEGTERRILNAAVRHQQAGIIKPIVLGNRQELEKLADEEKISLQDLEIIDPENYDGFEEMVDAFVERRKGKATRDQAEKILKDRNYFGTMLIYMGLADGLISGADGTTAETIRPALQIIKTKPDSKLVSGCFIMISPDGKERLMFADSAVNINPDSSQLADIAYETANTAKDFDIDPVVALLSFSTLGSASSPEQEKVAEATKIAKERYPQLKVDGELQFDAAINPVVAKKKAPKSDIAGKARVFIFPDIQSGNIGYKIAQRLGHYIALGPILQGMAHPVNDLSRGCSEEDAYQMAIVTAYQAMKVLGK